MVTARQCVGGGGVAAAEPLGGGALPIFGQRGGVAGVEGAGAEVVQEADPRAGAAPQVRRQAAQVPLCDGFGTSGALVEQGVTKRGEDAGDGRGRTLSRAMHPAQGLDLVQARRRLRRWPRPRLGRGCSNSSRAAYVTPSCTTAVTSSGAAAHPPAREPPFRSLPTVHLPDGLRDAQEGVTFASQLAARPSPWLPRPTQPCAGAARGRCRRAWRAARCGSGDGLVQRRRDGHGSPRARIGTSLGLSGALRATGPAHIARLHHRSSRPSRRRARRRPCSRLHHRSTVASSSSSQRRVTVSHAGRHSDSQRHPPLEPVASCVPSLATDRRQSASGSSPSLRVARRSLSLPRPAA